MVVLGVKVNKPLELLTEDKLHALDSATMKVLERVGILIKNDFALNLLEKAGANVNFEKKMAKIPEDLIKEQIKKAPSEFILYARNPKRDVLIGNKRVHFRGGGGQIFVIDPKNKTRRFATLKDLEKGTRLLDGLEHIHTLGSPGIGNFVTPQDVPLEVRDLYSWKILFENSEKPIGAWIYSSLNAKYVIKMGEAVAGGLEKLEKRPLVGYVCEATSPLQYSSSAIEILLEMAKHRFPVYFAPMPMAGGTSPITLAGTLVIHNAEVLTGILIAQLANPGTPCVYGAHAHTLDMRTCQITFGSCEGAMLNVALTQLAHFYGLPSCSASGFTDSKLCDAQAGFETGMTLILPALAGCNMNGPIGILGSDQGASFEQAVIEDEIASVIYRILKGIKITDETLALDTIEKVGIGGHYLAQKHTINYLKEGEHILPIILDRQSWELWKERNSTEIVDRARKRAQEILDFHLPEPLSEEIKKELEGTLEEAKKVILKNN